MKIASVGKISTIILVGVIVLIYLFKTDELHFTVKGRIAGFSSNPYTVLIEHEKIPGYMDAMTMPFQVQDSLELSELEQGQTIQFEYYVKLKEQKSYINSIKVIPDSLFKSNEVISLDLGINTSESSNYVQVGEKLPNYSLIDQDGNTISTNEFLGKKLVFTFIYTSCPVPDYCPLMSYNFNEVHNAIRQSKKDVMLLSISFDLKRDNPKVLKEYGKKYVGDFNTWKFVTGTKESIENITSDFSVLTQLDGNQIVHNLRTVYVDENGTVQKIWPDNYWTADDIL
ncbi:redoxin domain-containing protein, partial [bacterium]